MASKIDPALLKMVKSDSPSDAEGAIARLADAFARTAAAAHDLAPKLTGFKAALRDIAPPDEIEAAGMPATSRPLYTASTPTGPSWLDREGWSKKVHEAMLDADHPADALWLASIRPKDESLMMAKVEEKIRGLRMDKVWLNEEEMAATKESKMKEPPLSEEAKRQLSALAEDMSEYFATHTGPDVRVALLSPANLTVTSGVGYSKRNFVGGEEFNIAGVYVGSPKRGCKLIFKLRPNFAAEFQHVEIEHDKCFELLERFRGVVNAAAGGDFIACLRDVRGVDDRKRAEQEAQKSMADYGEFGTW